MTAKIVKLQLVEVGENFRFDPDQILEGAKGEKFSSLVILGEQEDGELWISSTANAGEALILMEMAKYKLCGLGDD